MRQKSSKKSLFILAIIAMVSAFGSATRVQAVIQLKKKSIEDCDASLSKASSRPHQNSDAEKIDFQKKSLTTEAFEVLEVQNGQYGGKRYLIKKNLMWFDARKELQKGGADYVIDLRFIPELLGAQEAEFFGFRIVSDELMLIPDAEELRGAIMAFNETLPESSPLRILISPRSSKEDFESSIEYVRAFVNSAQVPVSREGRQFYHDISAHALEGLFLNNEIVALTKMREKLWQDFLEHLARSRTSDEKAAIESAHKHVYDELVSSVDNFGNFLGLFLSKKHRGRWDSEVDAYLRAKEKDLSRLEKKIAGWWWESAVFPKGPVVHRLEILVKEPSKFYKEILSSKLVPDFERFLVAYKAKNPDAFKRLSFDLTAEIETLKSRNEKKELTVKDLGEYKTTAPFVRRLKHLRKIINAK